ncbi:MAG: type VI secretion system ATPase TssH [Pirellulaceae bacterium]|nr:type VI secretion system ATPase TssH [Pirellulaceae bacterium]
MVQVDLSKLFDRLSPLSNSTIDLAIATCVKRTNYNVELEHWLMVLGDSADSDYIRILESFEVDLGRLKADLTKCLDRLKTGNSKSPSLSPDVVELATEAWTLATINYSAGQIRTGHLLIALLLNESLKRAALGASRQFEKINAEALTKNFVEICSGTSEDRESTNLVNAAAEPSAPGGSQRRNTPSLDQFTIDLTARAREGKIDAVLGRDTEIRQVIDILTRRRQNNPILTGEAGVGKTAVAEGFALRIASGDVPAPLKDVALRTLDLGLLQAGAGVKGEFENRLKSVIDEVKSSPKPIILFIDEAHTLIGAGGAAGQGDAANLLKPALARGELRTIAATTWAEYKKYFERDAALARRFQVVKVEEPSEAVAIEMVRGLTKTLEKHHKVHILEEAIIDAVKLSSRYISGRQLPDKAISLIDTACARINLSQSSTPPALENAQRELAQLKLAREILEREAMTGSDHVTRLAEIQGEVAGLETRLTELKERWDNERAIVADVHQLTAQLHTAQTPAAAATNNSPAAAANAPTSTDGIAPAAPSTPAAPPATPEQIAVWKGQLNDRRQSLLKLQGESPLVHPFVDRNAIAETVAAWTGIPVGRMVADEIKTVLNLHDLMEKQIVGQSHALKRIAQAISTSRAQLNDPRAPIGVFLLAGTSGVGKTETAITLAQLLYGGEQNMTVINMSEFKEEHKVSLLMGSPPGYVGYGEGGVLTEAVRRKPYSVILLDEMEKAHPGVQDVFYQVFDKGTMKDGEGRDIDFKNTVIIMTSNAGTDVIKSICSDPDTTPEPEPFMEAIFPELLKTFKPAFLGRLTLIPYYPLAEHVIRKIIGLKLGKIGKRLADNYKAKFNYTDDLVQLVADRCKEVDTGARNIDHILTRSLLPDLSAKMLGRLAEGKSITSVTVTITPEQTFAFEIE